MGLDREGVIRFDDFSSTMASFVGSHVSEDDDSLQTMFEIFDIDEDGYLRVEDFARIFLTQNQIAVVSTGGTQDSVYTKKQCLKQARRIMAQCDCHTQNGRISFEQFKVMMRSRTEREMMLDHMPAPSITVGPGASMSAIPGLRGIIPPMNHASSINSMVSVSSINSLEAPKSGRRQLSQQRTFSKYG